MTGASEPTSGIANLDAPTATWAGDLSIQHERHTTHCSFAGAFHCPGTRVVAQLRGDLLLACVPQNQGADCDRFLRTEERRCVLVDFKRSTCHDLTSFDDMRFLANGRLEVTAPQRAPLCRTPSSVWDMDHFGRLQDLVPSTDVSWNRVHAVFAFDEGLKFVSVDTRAE
jgi:hypothetical protein